MFFFCYNPDMRRNFLHYQRALFLRRKKGYSYREIRGEVPVAKSTLSLWLQGIELSPEQIQRIKSRTREALIKRRFNLPNWNREKRQKEITVIRVKAKKEINLLSKRDFLIAGIMLYWAEGRKGGSEVQISNADPLLIQFMMSWFRTFMPISEDRFVASIHYHEGQNEDQIKKFWSEMTNIPLEYFQKSFKKPPSTGHRTHYLQWGVVRVRIRRSAGLYHQIAGWKDGLIQNIIFGSNNVRP